MILIIIVLIFLLTVCVVSAAKWKVSTHALIAYMQQKDYTLPSDAEMEAYSDWVWKKMLGIR